MRGTLNDDSSPVGRRHLAFVFEYRVSEHAIWDQPKRGEKSITNLQWLDSGQARVNMSQFEYWSQLCLQAFFPFIGEGQPNFLLRRKRPLRPPHLLCVVGEIGSGKSQTTRVLLERHNYVEINSGRVLARILNIPPVPDTPRQVFQQRALDFIQHEDGPRRLADEIYDQAIGCGSDRVIVDGIRQVSTLEALRARARPLRVGMLFVHTPPHIAFEFYSERDAREQEGSFSIHDFLRLRDNAVEQEVRALIGKADAVLYNWNGVGEYRKTIQALMAEVHS